MTSEAVFTGPTATCPHPERWRAPDAWATEEEVTAFLAALCRLLRPSRVLETGTYAGHTAQAMGEVLAEHGGHLDTLEIDYARAQRVSATLVGLPVTVHAVDSADFVPDAPYDLCFFDSDPAIRASEMSRFRRHVTPGAIWLLHDTASHPSLRDDLSTLVLRGVIGAWIEFSTPRGLAMGMWAL